MVSTRAHSISARRALQHSQLFIGCDVDFTANGGAIPARWQAMRWVATQRDPCCLIYSAVEAILFGTSKDSMRYLDFADTRERWWYTQLVFAPTGATL